MVSASCVRRCAGLRSVFLLICPKLEIQLLVRSTGQRSPIGWFLVGSDDPRLRFLAMTASSRLRSARRCRVASES